MENRIAIIGGGASGTITTIRLVQKLYKPAVIYLIEKHADNLNRGAAYSSKLEYEPLNVPCGKMSAFNHLPDSFFNWVRNRRDSSVHKDSYVSRRWYGDYLQETFNTTVSRSKLVRVQVVAQAVNDISATDSGAYSIQLVNEELLEVDYVVLCTGNETPQQILNESDAALLKEKYVANPWNNTLDGLTGDEHIFIIGTGLTMVDYVCSLYARRHAGKIYCLSRNGLLPLRHAEELPYVPDTSFEDKTLKEVYKALRRNVARAQKAGSNWQSVMDAFRPRVSRIWRRLSAADRQTFINKYRKWWEIHRHRIPENSYRIIEQMKKSGQLEIIAGKYERVELKGPFAELTYRTAGTGNPKALLLHRIINCTGPLSDYYKTDNTLVKNLLNKGWMKQDELKLGIVTGIRGEVVNSRGIVLKNFYTVGPLRKASEWETTAIREIRTQADALSDMLVEATAGAGEVLTII